jgi:hypothetical protein
MTARRLGVALTMAALIGVGFPLAAQTRPGAPTTPAAQVEKLTAMRKQEDRMTAIGERLVTAAAAAGWCEPVNSVGWTLSELGQYPKTMRLAVRRAWGLAPGAVLFVSSVAPGGTAAAAGVTPGMGIVSIDGRVPMRNNSQYASTYALGPTGQVIQDALRRGPMQVEALRPDGTRVALSLRGRPACESRFEIAPDEDEQAYADGDAITLTQGMGRYTNDSDDELAAVLAHELGHNLLRHISREEEAGTPRDYTRYLNRYARVSRKMEEEADRMSVWLLAIAGYNPEAPVLFWQRFGPNHDSAHPFGRLHDPWRDRVAAVQDELALMRAQRAANPNARPALLDRRPAVPATAGARSQ